MRNRNNNKTDVRKAGMGKGCESLRRKKTYNNGDLSYDGNLNRRWKIIIVSQEDMEMTSAIINRGTERVMEMRQQER